MSKTALEIAFSPCPNDTFLFHAWVTGCIESPITPIPLLADIETLNSLALERRFPLIKVSMATLGHLLNDYALLPVGAALGHGCGPKIVASTPLALEDLKNSRVALPGEATTAHLLFDLFAEVSVEKVFCPYHQIFERIKRGEVDFGVIIHEGRFTFKEQGLYEIADLGELWFKKYRLPLPLGGIAVKRSLGSKKIQQIEQALKDSLLFAKSHPNLSQSYILEHSQEKRADIIEQHIQLYVNEESLNLSSAGQKAIETLLNLGFSKGHFPTTLWNV